MDYCRAFLLFSGFALPVFGVGGVGVVGGVGGGGWGFATIIMLLPVSQQPDSASGVRSAAMPFGSGVCTPTLFGGVQQSLGAHRRWPSSDSSSAWLLGCFLSRTAGNPPRPLSFSR